MIQLKNIYKSFGHQQVLTDLNLMIPGPGVTAVLGPNGSGKTTLIKSILGLVIPDKGAITVNETIIRKQWSYRSQIGYLPQIARFPENIKVYELINLVKDLRQAETREEELITRFGIREFLNKKLGHLSGGSQQKVNLVLAFMFDCPILILDEPTSGLDPVAMLELKALIREEASKGKTILITSHIMSFVEEMTADIVFLLDGQIQFQGNQSLLKKQMNEPTLEKAIAALLVGQSPETIMTPVVPSH